MERKRVKTKTRMGEERRKLGQRWKRRGGGVTRGEPVNASGKFAERANLRVIDSCNKMSRRPTTEPGHAAPCGRKDKTNIVIGSD